MQHAKSTDSPSPQTTETIRAITLHQPYAAYVADGYKAIETRGWQTPYRGPLAIHAGKLTKAREEELEELDAHDEAGITADDFYWSAIVAVVDLADCERMTERFCEWMRVHDWNEWAMGYYAPGRFAWHLTYLRKLPHPIPCRGYQGLWTPDEDVQRQIREALAARAPAQDGEATA